MNIALGMPRVHRAVRVGCGCRVSLYVRECATMCLEAGGPGLLATGEKRWRQGH